MINIAADIESLLKQTLIAVISTVDKHGRPRSTPIWFNWEDGAAYMFTDRSTLKWRNPLIHPYACLCIDWRTPPYRSIIIDGTTEEVGRPVYDMVLIMAQRYYGNKEGSHFADQYKDSAKDTVIFRLIPDRIVNFPKK